MMNGIEDDEVVLTIQAKIGTHGSGLYRIKYKRKYPEVGDFVEFKLCDIDGRVERYTRWEKGVVWKINPETNNTPPFFFIERF